MRVLPCYLQAVGLINALGDGLVAVSETLADPACQPLSWRSDLSGDGRSVAVGAVNGVLPQIPASLCRFNTRNNRLLLAALEQVRPEVEEWIARVGASRVAVVVGTSTSGIEEGTLALEQFQQQGQLPAEYAYGQQELGDPAAFLQALLGVEGPCYAISTACSSSARAFISARRLLAANLADMVLVAGVDSLCRLTLNGFASLESLSAGISTPFATGRDGINIGEGAAITLLTREKGPVALLGAGESSDAYHISAPHPEGVGAEAAMAMALAQAGLNADEVGYINLHGTGTRLNDEMEAKAIWRLFGNRVPCSSTKPLTGHTLGAAGATEAALCWLWLTRSLPLPAQRLKRGQRDESLCPIAMLREPTLLPRPVILSNSFAFGGNNVSLLLARSD